jgi:IstB-like ATP binding protein
MTAPTVTLELRALLRRVKLGRCLDTLPERLALAQTGGMGHAEFLELVLADEVTRRETTSADRRARAAGLDASMTLDRWDDTAKVTYDHAIWNELCSLRFIDGGHNAVIMGQSGSARRFWPPPSVTPRSAAATACTSNAATGLSSGSGPAGSTTAMRWRCASCCA